ncbi:MAG: aspartate carbamoyltransferase [Candidatus Shapirobacteria bacterium]
MNILSVEQFDKNFLDSIFQKTLEFRDQSKDPQKRRDLLPLHYGQQMCSLFFEPSTRTRVSFELGAQKLGMGLVSTENAHVFSSAIKGETLEDTIKVISNYDVDVIVMRHNETGAADRAAKVSEVPIINAGDGKGEHPTQALLDTFTIYEKFGRLDNLKVVMGGDLANGRTVRSLAKLLSLYDGNQIDFVSTAGLRIGDDIKETLQNRRTSFKETEDMNESLATADVIYWTRTQKERIDDQTLIGENLVIDKSKLEIIPRGAIILHPLPRVNEITTEVDDDPRAYYFKQAKNGLYVRMALIDEIVERSG